MGDGPVLRAAVLPAPPSSLVLPHLLAFFAIVHSLGIGRACIVGNFLFRFVPLREVGPLLVPLPAYDHRDYLRPSLTFWLKGAVRRKPSSILHQQKSHETRSLHQQLL